MHRTARGSVSTALMCAVLAVGAWFVLPMQLGGSTAYVATRGSSMEPWAHTGDLAILRPSSAYQVGDIAAYHSELLDSVVLHRIVDVDGDRYTLKGDNNSWLDPETPTSAEVLGKAWLRIPDGGVWLARATSPVAVGLMAFGLIATGGAVVRTRHRKRRTTMARHVYRTSPSLSTLPPHLATAGAVAAVAGVLGLVLGLFAWAVPESEAAEALTAPGARVEFSYSAKVPRSAAYDGTTVRAPETVFRALAEKVDVAYSYRGDPGTVAVVARLSTGSGWTSTVPLAKRATFNGERHSGVVTLDLRDLARRARAAGDVVGIPVGDVRVDVQPRFVTADGVFAPKLPFGLDELRLTLADPAALTANAPATVLSPAASERRLDLLGWSLPVAAARLLSVAVVAAALLLAGLVWLAARLSWSSNEAVAIHRRYGPILVRVHPMPTTPGRPVVDVTDFATLAKLAERYGLLVMHWSRSDVETFLVQDEGTTYRYRTGGGGGAVPAAEGVRVGTASSGTHLS